MPNIKWNIFHIILVASLLCILAKNLKEDKIFLQNFTYTIVALMTSYHSYLIYKKINSNNFIIN